MALLGLPTSLKAGTAESSEDTYQVYARASTDGRRCAQPQPSCFAPATPHLRSYLRSPAL